MTNPLRQGRLDGLCGVYSVINAINNLYVLNEERREKLFKVCIKYLDDNNILKQSILNGILVKHIKKMLDACGEFLQKNGYEELSYSPIITKDGNITSVWTAVDYWIHNDSKKHVIIVGIGRTHDHWSCIVEIKEKLVYFCDSSGLKQLKKKDFTTGDTMTNPHLLNHKELLAVWVE